MKRKLELKRRNEQTQNKMIKVKANFQSIEHPNFTVVSSDNSSVITLRTKSNISLNDRAAGLRAFDAEKVASRVIALKHESILECKEVIPDNEESMPVFHMETFSNKTLFDILDVGLSEENKLDIALTLINALIYYEKQDLFPTLALNSIMVCEHSERIKVKILDETIIKLDDKRYFKNPFSHYYTASEVKRLTLAYDGEAPETYNTIRFQTNAQSAIFSFGKILLNLFTGGERFAHINGAQGREFFYNLMANTEANKYSLPKSCPSPWSDLIHKCLNTNPQARPALTEVRDELLILPTKKAIKTLQQKKDSLFSIIPKDVANKELMDAIQSFGLFQSQLKTSDLSSNDIMDLNKAP